MDNVLNSWGHAIQEAAGIDQKFREVYNITGQQWCMNWTLIHTSALMDVHMGLQMELDLLSANELDYYLWYWDYILNSRVYAINQLRESRYKLELTLYKSNVEEASQLRDKILAAQKARIRNKKNSKSNSKDKKGKDKEREKEREQRERDLQANEALELEKVASVISSPVPSHQSETAQEHLIRARGNIYRALLRQCIAANFLKCENMLKIAYPFGIDWEGRFNMVFIYIFVTLLKSYLFVVFIISDRGFALSKAL